ncbi:hypothetical protein QQS21_006027 [Conoideocrella luteorostrata]|uniref:Triacylglycerol lipase n=1 Tax=Conoideocrella luteorostrata TaxID=1105319 RepID=A0AAJ0FTW6_9HYPO|nr:hypothetical protein QQS21_006027 [Conoideocrella luteorostrata]
MASMAPKILAISLNTQPWFDEMFAPLLTELQTNSTFRNVQTASAALQVLSEDPKPSAVLITDEGLTLRAHKSVWEEVVKYVRQGGTAVIMGLYPAFVKPNNMKPFFSQAGLDWEAGSYHRTTLTLNQAVVGEGIAKKLPQNYSQKAVFVKNVVPREMWYKSDDSSVIESRVFAPDSAHTPGETAVAMAEVGEGKLGYVGDVNAEEESTVVVLAMVGLLNEIAR